MKFKEREKVFRWLNICCFVFLIKTIFIYKNIYRNWLLFYVCISRLCHRGHYFSIALRMRLRIASFAIRHLFMLISDFLYFFLKYFKDNFLGATFDIFCEFDYVVIYLLHI